MKAIATEAAEVGEEIEVVDQVDPIAATIEKEVEEVGVHQVEEAEEMVIETEDLEIMIILERKLKKIDTFL